MATSFFFMFFKNFQTLRLGVKLGLRFIFYVYFISTKPVAASILGKIDTAFDLLFPLQCSSKEVKILFMANNAATNKYVLI